MFAIRNKGIAIKSKMVPVKWFRGPSRSEDNEPRRHIHARKSPVMELNPG